MARNCWRPGSVSWATAPVVAAAKMSATNPARIVPSVMSAHSGLGTRARTTPFRRSACGRPCDGSRRCLFSGEGGRGRLRSADEFAWMDGEIRPVAEGDPARLDGHVVAFRLLQQPLAA